MSGLDLERAMISPLCLGIAERALELSIDYAQTRQQFGKPIGTFQMVQRQAGRDVCAGSRRCALFTYRALRAATTRSRRRRARRHPQDDARRRSCIAAETLNKVLDKAVQIHGGAGYIWESEINRLYRSTKLLEIGAGTTEVRKMIIGGELLRG